MSKHSVGNRSLKNQSLPRLSEKCAKHTEGEISIFGQASNHPSVLYAERMNTMHMIRRKASSITEELNLTHVRHY